jgi:hypothetical protein
MMFDTNLWTDPEQYKALDLARPYSCGSDEPHLQDLLADPLIRLLISADNLSVEQVSNCLEKTKENISRYGRMN